MRRSPRDLWGNWKPLAGLHGGSRHRWMFRVVVSLCAIWILIGCSGSSKKRDQWRDEKPIRAQDERAQSRFEQALRKLEEGQYATALDEFRLIQSEFSDDPIAVLAELYGARASLGRLQVNDGGVLVSSASSQSLEQARASFMALTGAQEADERIQWAAALYAGIAAATLTSSDSSSPDSSALIAALKSLAAYPSPSVSQVVLERDRFMAWFLLTEALFRQSRHTEAIVASGELFRELGQGDDTGVLDASQQGVQGSRATAGEMNSNQDKGSYPESVRLNWLQYARERAFSAALLIKPAEVESGFIDAPNSFERAVLGWMVLSRRLDEPAEGGEVEALESVFNRVAADLVAIDATERAGELSLRLAAKGGPRRLVIGAIVPMSGPHRNVGARAISGILLAQRAFASGAEPRITVAFVDSTQPADRAIQELHDLGAAAAIGPIDQSKASDFRKLAQEKELPLLMLTPGSLDDVEAQADGAPSQKSSVNRVDEQTYAFRNFLSVRQEARASAIAAFCFLGDRRASVLYPNMEYGRIMSEVFAAQFQRLGGQIIASLPYKRQASDFSKLGKRVASDRPDAVFIADTGSKVTEVVAFLADQNVWGLPASTKRPVRADRVFVHYMGTSLWQEPVLARQAASYINGALIPVWYSPVFEGKRYGSFFNQFQSVYGRVAETYESFAFDATNWLRKLLLEGGLNRRESVQQALLAWTFEGVTGQVRFSPSGEPQRAVRFIAVESGQFTPTDFEVSSLEARLQANAVESRKSGRDSRGLERPPGEMSRESATPPPGPTANPRPSDELWTQCPGSNDPKPIRHTR